MIRRCTPTPVEAAPRWRAARLGSSARRGAPAAFPLLLQTTTSSAQIDVTIQGKDLIDLKGAGGAETVYKQLARQVKAALKADDAVKLIGLSA